MEAYQLRRAYKKYKRLYKQLRYGGTQELLTPSQRLLQIVEQPAVTAHEITNAIANGANPNATDEETGTHALTYLCRNHHVTQETIVAMLEGGASCALAAVHGDTVLIEVCTNPSVTPGIIQVLVEAGVDVNQVDTFSENALGILCSNQGVTPDTIRMLTEAGVSVNTLSGMGTTAMINLCMNRTVTPETIQAMIDGGADTTIGSRETGLTALIALCRNPSVTPETIFTLASTDLDVNQRPEAEDDTEVGWADDAMWVLCRNTNVNQELIRALLDIGVDPSNAIAGATEYTRSLRARDHIVQMIREAMEPRAVPAAEFYTGTQDQSLEGEPVHLPVPPALNEQAIVRHNQGTPNLSRTTSSSSSSGSDDDGSGN